MRTYRVWVGEAYGVYEATDEQAARDAFCRDAGYQSEADMERQLEQKSEVQAREERVWP